MAFRETIQPRAGACAAALSLLALTVCAADAAPPAPRVEARSADLLVVGVVHDASMRIRISRLADNSPVSDAAVTVVLRGLPHATVAQADGSYNLSEKDLALPGAATVEFQIAEGALKETLQGTLQRPAAAGSTVEKSQVRQYGWWALNFGVCIGFLVLISRRKKKSADS